MALQENSLDVTRRDRKMISSLDQIDKILLDRFLSSSSLSQLMIINFETLPTEDLKGYNYKSCNLPTVVRVIGIGSMVKFIKIAIK